MYVFKIHPVEQCYQEPEIVCKVFRVRPGQQISQKPGVDLYWYVSRLHPGELLPQKLELYVSRICPGEHFSQNPGINTPKVSSITLAFLSYALFLIG